jgi:protein TonB
VFRRQAIRRPEGYTLLASSGAWSAAAANDRLASTMFLAALFHGILILGVTFTNEAGRPDAPVTSLDVVIVTRDYEKMAAPLEPALLAQRNLLGRGNAPLPARLRTALPQTDDVPLPLGPDQMGETVEPSPQGEAQRARAQLTAAARDRPTTLSAEQGAEAPQAAQRSLPRSSAVAAEILTEPDAVTVIPDARPRELLVSASTRESRIAGYLNAWKTRVERVGTLNFPRAAELSRIRAYPVLEVAIGADGKLREVVVKNSSGYRNLDQAAMEILRISAPFEPFPEPLRDDYDVLRFAYEWHFGRGTGAGRVSDVTGS